MKVQFNYEIFKALDYEVVIGEFMQNAHLVKKESPQKQAESLGFF